MEKVYFKNLINDSEDVIASDLIPQDLDFNSKDDLILKIQNEFTGEFVESKFSYSNTDMNELISESSMIIHSFDYEISAKLINTSNNQYYPITVYFDHTLRWGTLRMITESNMDIWGSICEDDGLVYAKLSIMLR